MTNKMLDGFHCECGERYEHIDTQENKDGSFDDSYFCNGCLTWCIVTWEGYGLEIKREYQEEKIIPLTDQEVVEIETDYQIANLLKRGKEEILIQCAAQGHWFDKYLGVCMRCGKRKGPDDDPEALSFLRI